jgi:hypothetical protein
MIEIDRSKDRNVKASIRSTMLGPYPLPVMGIPPLTAKITAGPKE